MKRFLSVFLLACLLLALAACSGPAETETQPASRPAIAGSDPIQSAQPGIINPAVAGERETTTLMIYMIGSDLEAKSKAGTNDLDEVLQSGVDLSCVNVLVNTGGSPHWHNDFVDKDLRLTLQLQKDGYKVIDSQPSSSMGEAESLAGFLQYCCQNAPADHYALILWDHGNGPVMGYGKDVLFSNDALTLLEMRKALENSPFGPDRKLDWVGFDACLMASAELACIWAPYADYLVASQEVEPAFGWNYSFLSELGPADARSVLDVLTREYLSSCEAYFEEKGYADRDATLACLDLSGADELSGALDELFNAASGNVADLYNELAAHRVETRALGRATTGSEYDLVDLLDMAIQLRDLYPEQTERLSAAIDRLVVYNATNAENLCGLSLYYPFYNKDYYTRSWAETYRALGLFEGYQTYLRAYETTWLGNDMLAAFGSSTMPSVYAADKYTLQLTAEQQEHFASARYYILRQDAEMVYTVIYVSEEVERQGGVLTADFDGSVIYGRTGKGDYFIPVVTESDVVGKTARYSTYLNLTNDTDYGLFERPAGYEHKVKGCRYHLSLDRDTGEVSVSALLPYDAKPEEQTMTEGKLDDVDLSEWTTYYFLDQPHRTLRRDGNGTVLAVQDWLKSDKQTASVFPIADGVSFVYKPLVSGSYCLIFEIQDTQGNRYCSEPLPIDVVDDGWYLEDETPVIPLTECSWTAGDELTLLEQDGYRLGWTVQTDYFGEQELTFFLENGTDRDLHVFATDLVCNGDILCDDGDVAYFNAFAGERGEDYGVSFGDSGDCGFLKDLHTIEFTAKITDAATRATVMERDFRVTVEGGVFAPESSSIEGLDTLEEPACGASAGKQTILSADGHTVELLGMGCNPIREGASGVLCITNEGNMASFAIDAAEINGITVPVQFLQADLPSGSKTYRCFHIKQEDLDVAGIDSIQNLRLALRIGTGGMNTWMGYGRVNWTEISLSQSGSTPSGFRSGSRTLLDQDGIRVAIWSKDQGEAYVYQPTDYPEEGNFYQYWYMTVENNTDEGICIGLTDRSINGVGVQDDSLDVYIKNGAQIGPHQRAVLCLVAGSDSLFGEGIVKPGNPARELRFRLRVQSFTADRDLWISGDYIVLEGEKAS